MRDFLLKSVVIHSWVQEGTECGMKCLSSCYSEEVEGKGEKYLGTVWMEGKERK